MAYNGIACGSAAPESTRMDQQLAELKAAKDAGELTLAEWLGARAAVRKSWAEVPRDPPAPSDKDAEEEEELVGVSAKTASPSDR